MSKYSEKPSEKEILAKKKQRKKKIKAKSLTNEVKNALDKKKFNKRQSY